jgi:hypothetical protein
MIDWLNLIPVAIVAAIIGGSVSYVIAARNVYISSITAERSKWIDKLRINLAAYSAAIAHTKLRIVGEQQNQAVLVREKLEQVNDLAALIQLQLNPRGVIDQNILRLVETIVIRSSTTVKLIQRADDLLIAHSQWLLKAEWEKVKYEARGPAYRALHWRDEARFIEAYKGWCSEQPSIDVLISEFDGERAKPPRGA